MDGARRFLFIAVTLAALVGVGGVSLAARQSGTQRQVTRTASIAFPVPAQSGGPRGVVVARQVGQRTSGPVHISLHRLMANTSYLVVANTRPCSQVVDAADYVVWRSVFRPTDGTWLKGSTVRLRVPLTRARSVRVYEAQATGRPRQRACGITGTYNSGTGVLT